MTDGPTIFVVDDDEAIRDSLQLLLEAQGRVVVAFATAAAFLAALTAGCHGCALIDVRLPDMSGLELQAEMKARGVTLPVVIITGFADVALAVAAMKAGAVDFIEKPFEKDTLLAAIDRALARDWAQTRQSSGQAAVLGKLARLTARERQVLDRIVMGHSNKLVARDLEISPRTVETYRARLMEKLEARSLSDLVRLALAAGPE